MIEGRKITNPHWANPEKTQIYCQFEYDDGTPKQDVAIADAEGGNPDWVEIMEEYGVEGVDKISQELLDKHNEQKSKREQHNKERKARHEKEQLFGSKMAAFEMNEIKLSKNTKLKTKIRKARNPLEVNVYATALVISELDKTLLKPKAKRKARAKPSVNFEVDATQHLGHVEPLKTKPKPRKAKKKGLTPAPSQKLRDVLVEEQTAKKDV